jgi:succinate-semialdehyde dehydrogenase/glutarate-semialdehyde dehydrogenase
VCSSDLGVPAGVINMVVGSDAPAIGNELTGSKWVRKLTFTGSTPVGKLLMKQCADTVKRTSMELGGNAPIIIFDDADLDQAINGALISKFRNSGQTCICSNRLLVQSGIYDRFIERLSEAVGEFRLGNGQDATTTHGPLITDKAALGVDEKVQDAVAQGARIVTGGAPSDQGSRFYQPTILADATPDMRVFREEIFGPVAPIFKFETDAEAIELANSTEYGLAAYLFTQNLSRIWKVSEAIDFGMVGVNETAISSEAIPFGGVKESGQGREGSKYGLDDYLETKLICLGGL